MKASEALARVRTGDRTIPIVREGLTVGRLRAVGADDADVLARWREANRRWFTTEFPKNPERTALWVGEVLSSPDRFLVVVETSAGDCIGHVGLRDINLESGAAEIDNVVRGSRAPNDEGLMAAAIEALLGFAVGTLGLRRIRLRVFTDNPAIDFYARLGFEHEGAPIGLAFDQGRGGGTWQPANSDPRRHLQTMVLGPARVVDLGGQPKRAEQ